MGDASLNMFPISSRLVSNDAYQVKARFSPVGLPEIFKCFGDGSSSHLQVVRHYIEPSAVVFIDELTC